MISRGLALWQHERQQVGPVTRRRVRVSCRDGGRRRFIGDDRIRCRDQSRYELPHIPAASRCASPGRDGGGGACNVIVTAPPSR
jgi:hypothetical protein